MDLVRHVNGVWTPNFDKILSEDGGESGEGRSAADCAMHPSDRYKKGPIGIVIVHSSGFVSIHETSATLFGRIML